jgi:hypothetical protein
VLAELLAHLDERAIADLLAQRDARPEVALLGVRRDLEQVEVQRASDRFAERVGQKARRNAAGGRRQG